MKKKISRTMYKVNTQNLKAYAAKMAGNGIGLTGYQAAINMLTEIMFAEKAGDKRSLTPDECTILIHQGGFK